MTHASRWLRRVEIALFVIGAALLGVALGAIVHRWVYQAEQEQALLRIAAASQLTPRASEGGPTPPSPAITNERSDLATPDEASPQESAEPLEPETLDEQHTATKPPPARPVAAAEPGTSAPLDPDVMGLIEIPRLGIRAIVRDGDDDATLARAVGFLSGTARPGEGGNTALAGHRDTFFRALRRIEVDDRIRFIVPPHTYEYRVESFRVVEPNEVSVLESTGTEELTLITCYPFRFIGPAPDRFIVKATRIQ